MSGEEDNLSDKIQQSIIFCSFAASLFNNKKKGSVGWNKARARAANVKKKKKNLKQQRTPSERENKMNPRPKK